MAGHHPPPGTGGAPAAGRVAHPAPTPPPAAELDRLYTTQGHTLAQLARRYHTSGPVVRAWLVDAGITVTPRTSRAHRQRLDPVLLRELYQDRQWSSPQIAAHLDSTVKTVLRTLHDHGIPVRRGGPPPRQAPDIDPRLTALYSDPEITALLRRYRIPRRHRPGGITDRFPTPARITPGFLRAAYLDIGLAAAHIEQLTGHPAEQVLDLLHQHRIPVRRASGHSPWYRRQHHHRR